MFPAIGVPGWASILLGVMALDFAIYLLHVLFQLFRRSGGCIACTTPNLEFDVSTGTRFHPIEVLLKGGWCKDVEPYGEAISRPLVTS